MEINCVGENTLDKSSIIGKGLGLLFLRRVYTMNLILRILGSVEWRMLPNNLGMCGGQRH